MNPRDNNVPRLFGLRILVVSPFSADSARGNAITAARIARRIESLGASTKVVFTNKAKPSNQTTSDLKIALAESRVDVLIGIHAGHFARALAGAGIDPFKRPKTGPALLLTIGGNELYEDLGIAPDSETSGLLRPASWTLFEHANAVLVATQHQRQAALEKRSKGVFLVPRYPEVGFGPVFTQSKLTHSESEPLVSNNLGPTLAWCGALRTQKRPEWILPIFHAVRAAHPNARLLLAGPEPDDSTGKDLKAELIATPGVLRIAPFTAGPLGSTGTLLSHTDLALNTSRTEGMSNFILESMHESVPVVAAASRGTASWVGDQARLFKDLKSGIDVVLNLLANPAAAKNLGTKGRAWVEAWASPECEAAAIADAVEACLEL